jgi:predicted nuclease with TOPRIM domain
MTDETANLILEHLRHLRSGLDAVREAVRDIKIRLTHVEEGLAGVNRRIDRVETRLDRIESRLGLVDAPI